MITTGNSLVGIVAIWALFLVVLWPTPPRQRRACVQLGLALIVASGVCAMSSSSLNSALASLDRSLVHDFHKIPHIDGHFKNIAPIFNPENSEYDQVQYPVCSRLTFVDRKDAQPLRPMRGGGAVYGCTSGGVTPGTGCVAAVCGWEGNFPLFGTDQLRFMYYLPNPKRHAVSLSAPTRRYASQSVCAPSALARQNSLLLHLFVSD